MSVKTCWVVVGYGMGGAHAKAIHEVEGIVLLGVCDVDAAKRERAAQDFPHLRLYSDFGDVLKDPDVDGVVIVLPHNLHAPLGIQAMEAGKHCITDKPLCLSVAEGRAMIEARDKNKVLLSTFHNRRWDSDFLTVQRVLDEELIGRLHHIQSCVTYWAIFGDTWRSKREPMGGWLFDWGAHTLDQFLLIAQKRNTMPTRVYAFAHHRFEHQNEVEDFVQCTVTFADGLTATTVISYLSRLPMPRWHIIGEKGALTCDDFNTSVRVKTTLGTLETEITVPQIKGDWKSFYQNVSEHLAGRAELIVQPEFLLPQLAIQEAAYRSIASGQVETVSL